jgi:GNAT superfamily N-acetyltransferase
MELSLDSNGLSFVEIVDIQDDRLMPYLDLYETSFPPSERILVSAFLNILKEKSQGLATGLHLIAVIDSQDRLVGMLLYELNPDAAAALLWYIAVSPDVRGKGIGARVYRKILEDIDPVIYKALLFEVEIPENEHLEGNAWRRIQFYRRQGARLLSGIHYIQHVGWHQPPIPMHIMVHPLREMNTAEIYPVVKAVFQENVEQVGQFSLE